MKIKKINSLLGLAAIVILAMSSYSCSKKEGCTDPNANNFDTEAEKDDGSCTYDVIDIGVPHPEESHLTFVFSHNFDGVPVTAANFNQFNFVTQDNDTINISRLRYLVSDIRLFKINGDSVVMNGYHLVDLEDGLTLAYQPGEVDFGAYTNIGFNFGFDTTDNAGNYADLNSAVWNVPTMLGGGYHCMQFEGKFKVNGSDSSYSYHHIPLTRPNMTSNFEANHVIVKMPGVGLNQHNVVIEVQMNIAEWFRNPNTWDLNVLNSGLMMNYNAQKMMRANGYNVFSLGNISQKQR